MAENRWATWVMTPISGVKTLLTTGFWAHLIRLGSLLTVVQFLARLLLPGQIEVSEGWDVCSMNIHENIALVFQISCE